MHIGPEDLLVTAKIGVPAELTAADLVTTIVYPSGYALLLLFAAELATRVRAQRRSADMLTATGLLWIASAAMWVTAGFTLSAHWIVTVPDMARYAFPADKEKNVVPIDYEKMNVHKSQYLDRWNKEVLGA